MPTPPLVICGMHRSGTSAAARLLGQAGLDLGDRLMPARLDNPVGYFEDLDFYELDRALIAAGLAAGPVRSPDWAHADALDPERLAPLRPRARALLDEHGAADRPWGFKDPRATMLLGFYEEVAPDARYLFLYREPWDVVASLFRVEDPPLRGQAGLAVRAWMAHNAALLAFRGEHPGRTALVHVDAVAQRPEAVVGLVQARLEAIAPTPRLDPGPAAGAFVGALLERLAPTSALAELLAADHPEAVALYDRLQAEADLPGLAAPAAAPRPAVAVELGDGPVELSVVLVGADGGEVPEARFVARPATGGDPCLAADAGVGDVPGDVAVVFDGRPAPGALAAAAAALTADPAVGVVLLTGHPAEDAGAVADPDLLARPDAGAGVVLRREAWLAVRGFRALGCPAGYEAWSCAVACAARGFGVLRRSGGLDLPEGPAAPGDAGARAWALLGHPGLTAQRLERLEAERGATLAELDRLRAATDAERASAAAARDAAAAELERLRATRAWRIAVGWWRLRERLRRRLATAARQGTR